MKTSISLSFSLLLSIFLVLNTTNTHASEEVYQLANTCKSIKLYESGSFISKQDNLYLFSTQTPSNFYLRPAALGVYLLLDENGHYLSVVNGELSAVEKLESEMLLEMPETNYMLTPAEWELHFETQSAGFLLKNIKEDKWLMHNGLSTEQNEAARISFVDAQACTTFPESETGATGTIQKTQFENGMLWGFVDAHEHSGANHGFGGKIFHGASFHKLGVEHALADCEKHHGVDGSKDLMSISYKSGSGKITLSAFLKNLYMHLIKDTPDHKTDGYPTLSDWEVHKTPTHQTLYYKWIERAYLGGMRIMVEYAESTEVVCEVYKDLLPMNSDVENCNEMLHVDHQLEKIKELQNYVDAQHGGPGKGWFRIVYSPEEAREVVKSGKLAVILGIEVENPFNCFVNERQGFESCNPALVREHLNTYYNKGIRALFPSHKFNNSFSSGDGNPGILEIGDYVNTGKWRSYAACDDVPGEFSMNSHGEGRLKSLFTKLAYIPGIEALNNWLSEDGEGQFLPIYPIADNHCQTNGFTELGLELIDEMMSLGMIIDLGHTPKPALNQLIPVLVENDYPAVHTHGGDQAAINLIKGISTRGLGDACRDEVGQSDLKNTFSEILAQVDSETGLPRKGLSYDFNGFAGYNRARFGEKSRCETEQKDPLEYPFTSIGGDIVFEALTTGERTFDYNTDGLANVGLFPDLIEEARRSGVSTEEINALFKTAEAYIQIWKRAEAISRQREAISK